MINAFGRMKYILIEIHFLIYYILTFSHDFWHDPVTSVQQAEISSEMKIKRNIYESKPL